MDNLIQSTKSEVIPEIIPESETKKPGTKKPETKEPEQKIIYITQPAPNPNPIVQECPNQILSIFYTIFHTLMSLTAVYLTFRCNNGFNVGSVIVALFFPYVYIIYTLATKGTCGILEKRI